MKWKTSDEPCPKCGGLVKVQQIPTPGLGSRLTQTIDGALRCTNSQCPNSGRSAR